MLNKVISVCNRSDSDVFKISARYIRKYISAKKFVVIVPEKDLDYFYSLKIDEFNIESEEKYPHIYKLLKKKKLGLRFGWYLQQFIKMAELDDGNVNDINLIWDADTIPLRKIEFEKNGKLYFFQGKEYNLPYFKLIKSLIGSEKLISTSFIAQCLPYKVKWFRNFKKEIEKKNYGNWFEEIINLIDLNENSGFSEYETLGTYAVRNFKNEMVISNNTDEWYRYGNSLIDSPKNIHKYHNRLKTRYKFISFESWDKKRVSLVKKIFKIYLGF